MEITAIKQQVKRSGRYSIYVAGKYAFSLSDTALLSSKLVPGQSLSEADVERYKKLSDDDKMYGRVLQYVSIRPRSTWELEQYLKRKKADPLLSEEILNRLSDNGTLNDEAFAARWVESRRLLKPMSRRRLMQELRAKHVDGNIAEAAIREDETEDQTILRQIINKKRRQTRYQDDMKLTQYLVRQGFNYDDVKAAVSKSTESNDDEYS